jgi:hypothetical protein
VQRKYKEQQDNADNDQHDSKHAWVLPMSRWWPVANIAIVALWFGLAGALMGLGLYIFAAAFAIFGLCMAAQPFFWSKVFRRGFRCGWLEGRMTMLSSIQEAQQRRMTMPEWLEAELERDGIPFVKIEVEGDAPE